MNEAHAVPGSLDAETPKIEDGAIEPDPDGFLTWILDRWIQILGIVFLLLGVGFLFKYSYEHGLLIPPLRVACGLGIGGVLAVAGWKVRDARRRLSHVLLGGSSAALYITMYAASALYDLVWEPVAFGGMMAVTMATFVAATAQRHALLANIAAIGGFVTPFLLDGPFGAFEDLGTLAYMCLLLAGSTAIFLLRGWRTLLITSSVAIWSYLALALGGAASGLEHVAVQGAIVLAWLATGAAPVARLYLVGRGDVDDGSPVVGRTLAHVFAFVIPAVAMLWSRFLWDLGDPAWGLVSLGVAGVYGAATLYLHRTGERGRLALTHFLLAVGFGTLALTDFLSGPTLMTALLGESVALCWLGHLGRREQTSADRVRAPIVGTVRWLTRPHRIVTILGHGLLFACAADSISIFALSAPGMTPFIGPHGLQLLMTAAAIAAVGRFHEPEAVRPGFSWAAHILFMGAVLHQSTLLEHGDVVSTAIWSVYSLILIAHGLRSNRESVQWMGLLALLLAAVKLIAVDMSGAETLWRVLLFIGLGAALLLLNYVAPRWSGSATETGDETSGV